MLLLNCGVGEDSWEPLGLQGDPTSPSESRSILGVHWKDWWWSWNSNTLATSCEKLTHWKRPWCWEGLGAGGEGVDRGWDGWMASPTRWTWVWVISRSWWWTGRPGMLRFMGSQRVRHDWVTELNWTELTSILLLSGSIRVRSVSCVSCILCLPSRVLLAIVFSFLFLHFLPIFFLSLQTPFPIGSHLFTFHPSEHSLSSLNPGSSYSLTKHILNIFWHTTRHFKHACLHTQVKKMAYFYKLCAHPWINTGKLETTKYINKYMIVPWH